VRGYGTVTSVTINGVSFEPSTATFDNWPDPTETAYRHARLRRAVGRLTGRILIAEDNLERALREAHTNVKVPFFPAKALGAPRQPLAPRAPAVVPVEYERAMRARWLR
jgi:hypothetical protein